jgi:hypothetical protein
MNTATRRRHIDDDDPSNPIGPDGLLKDGHRLRVPMLMRDAVSIFDSQGARAAEAARITEAIETTKRAMQVDGSPGNPYVINTCLGDAYAAHKPGFRYAADASSTTYQTEDPGPGLGTGADEWARHYTRLRRSRRWQERDPEGRERGTVSEESNDAVPAMSAGALARLAWIDSVSNAWRTPNALELSPGVVYDAVNRRFVEPAKLSSPRAPNGDSAPNHSAADEAWAQMVRDQQDARRTPA